MTRLSDSLIDTAARFRADADAELAAGNPESYETLTALAGHLERIAGNHRAAVAYQGDPSLDPPQIEDPRDVSVQRFRARRAELGMTQADLAAALGVNQITVSRWERGVQRIPGHAMLALDALAAQRQEDLT